MKKAIFINGTYYTGSTILDIILGSSDEVFSCGEALYLYIGYWKDLDYTWSEFRQKYADRKFWSKIKKNGINNFFQSIYNLTNKKVISLSQIDIHNKVKEARLGAIKSGFKVYNILIWKTIDEQLRSFSKRDIDNNDMVRRFQYQWIDWIPQYLKLNPIVIKYKDFTTKPKKTLKKLFNKLDLTYDDNILEFYKKKQNFIFGNSGVIRKIHRCWENGEKLKIKYKVNEIPIEKRRKMVKHLKQTKVLYKLKTIQDTLLIRSMK